MTPQRIQLSRAKGWRMPPNAIKCDRTTRWGNPYRIGLPVDMVQVRRWGWDISPQGRAVVCQDAAEAVRRFRHCVAMDEAFHPFLRQALGGRDLACWCGLGEPWCHVDVLIDVANPGAGGSTAAMADLNRARDEARKHIEESQ